MRAYLDCAAHAPIDPFVAEFMQQQRLCGNPRNRSHRQGREAAQAIQVATQQVARLMGAAESELVTFTSGATESNNQVLLGIQRKHSLPAPFQLVTSQTEHASILGPARMLEEQESAIVHYLPVDANGNVILSQLKLVLEAEQVNLVSIAWVNNETGAIQPIDKISEIARANNTPLHVDATQAVGRVDTRSLSEMAEFISISAHKMGGPSGVGALIGDLSKLEPLMYGGGVEQHYRPGTPPADLIAGFGMACQRRLEKFEQEQASLFVGNQKVRTQLGRVGRLISPEDGAGGIVCVAFDGVEADTLLTLIDDVALSRGAACTGASIESSHVLQAMGVPDRIALGAIRVSFTGQTDQAELDFGLKRILQTLSQMLPGVPALELQRADMDQTFLAR